MIRLGAWGRRGIPAVLPIFATAFAAVSPAAAQAPNLTPELLRDSRMLAASHCQGCHGMDGLSKQANAPNIAAQPFDYLVAQLHAYRGGTRQQEQMSIVAKALTDDEIVKLAAYYAKIEIEAVSIPGR